MIEIKDKKDSVRKMKELRLNYFPLDVFEVDDIEGIRRFLEENPSEEYVLRSANKTKSDFFFAKNIDEIKKYLKNFDGEVTLCVSYRPYKEDLILVGDILVKKRILGRNC